MISGATHTPASGLRASEHAARYEAIRSHVTEHHTLASREGLAVLLRDGVAVWMEAWSKMPAPPVRPTKKERAQPWPLPDDAMEVVHVLAAMALGHVQEVHA